MLEPCFEPTVIATSCWPSVSNPPSGFILTTLVLVSLKQSPFAFVPLKRTLVGTTFDQWQWPRPPGRSPAIGPATGTAAPNPSATPDPAWPRWDTDFSGGRTRLWALLT